MESVKRYNMGLNLAKFSLDMHSGKFLGFMLTPIEIEANSYKC